MIEQGDGEVESILEHFTLQPCDFALTLHSVQNFAPSPQLSDLIQQFRIDLRCGCEISLRYLDMIRKLQQT